MSGSEEEDQKPDPKWNCRIGKVKPKFEVIETTQAIESRVREMFVTAIQSLDEGATEEGGEKVPIVGMCGIVHSDGTVMIDFRGEYDDDDDGNIMMPLVDWRHLTMLLEDMAQDIRNFQLYRQLTPHKKLSAEKEEG